MANADGEDIDESFLADTNLDEDMDLGDLGNLDDTNLGDLGGDLDDTNFDDDFGQFALDDDSNLDGMSKENSSENVRNHNGLNNNNKERSVSQSLDINVKDESHSKGTRNGIRNTTSGLRNDKKDEAEDLEDMDLNSDMKAKEQQPSGSEVSSVASMAMPSSEMNGNESENQSNTKKTRSMAPKMKKMQKMQKLQNHSSSHSTNQPLLGIVSGKRRFSQNPTNNENATDSKRRKRNSEVPGKMSNFQLSLNLNQGLQGRNGLNSLNGSGSGSGMKERLSLDSNSSFSSTTAMRGSMNQEPSSQLRLNGLSGLLAQSTESGKGGKGQQEQMKDDPVDVDMLVSSAQQKMNKIFELWQQAKAEYAQKRKEIEEEFEKDIDLKLMNFGQNAQSQLQEVSETVNKNNERRREIGRTSEMLKNQPSASLLG